MPVVLSGGAITDINNVASQSVATLAGAAGDLQYLFVVYSDKSVAPTTYTGWSIERDLSHAADPGRLVVLKRTVGGGGVSAGTMTLVFAGAVSGVVTALNVAGGAQVGAVTALSQSWAEAFVVAGRTGTVDASVVVTGVATASWARSFTASAGWTELAGSENYGDEKHGVVLASKSVNIGVASGSITFTPADPYVPGGSAGDAFIGVSLLFSPTGGGAVVPVVSGQADLPLSSAITSISLSPKPVTLTAGNTATITVRDQTGSELPGVVFTSSNAAIATVSSPSSGAGTATVTAVGSGSATISGQFADPSAGVLSDSLAVTVGLFTPIAPSGLIAQAPTPGAVALTWTDNASNETAYIVQRASAPSGPFTQLSLLGAGVSSASDPSVVAGLTYYYRVLARNVSGDSAPSNVAAVTVPVAPDTQPPTVALSVSTNSVLSAGSSVVLSAIVSDNRGVTQIRFLRDSVVIATLPVTPVANTPSLVTTTQAFASAADNGIYSYSAIVFDAQGNSGEAPAQVVTVAIASAPVTPNAPSALVAVPAQASVSLGWADNSSNESRFEVERRTGVGSFSKVGEVSAGITTFVDLALLATTTYTYRVRAVNGTGASGYTSEVTVSTLSGAATSLASMTVSATTISEVSGQTKSVTYTALDGNGSGRPGVTVSWTVADTSVATVSPTTAVTDATGRAYAQITLGSVVAQTTLTATATDGQTGLGASQIPAVAVFSLPLFTEALVKELQAEQSDPKYEDEIQPYVWDFSPYFGRGETIKRVVAVTSEPVGGAERDPASAAMIFGDARVVSTRVLQYFRDGVPGVAYLLRCRIESTIGRIVVSEIRIRIYRARGARVSSSSPVVD